VSSELSFSFLTRRKFIQIKFTENLQHSMALKPTVFDASNIAVNSLTVGAKTDKMIRGPQDRRDFSLVGGYAANPFRHIITGGESWFSVEYQHASRWSVSRDEVLQKVNPVIGTAKLILLAIWASTASPARFDAVTVQI
jgi:hypothetical protein